jgi:hypothetical protein
MRGKGTFDIAGNELEGGLRGKSTFDIAGIELDGEMRGESTFDIAGNDHDGLAAKGTGNFLHVEVVRVNYDLTYSKNSHD